MRDSRLRRQVGSIHQVKARVNAAAGASHARPGASGPLSRASGRDMMSPSKIHQRNEHSEVGGSNDDESETRYFAAPRPHDERCDRWGVQVLPRSCSVHPTRHRGQPTVHRRPASGRVDQGLVDAGHVRAGRGLLPRHGQGIQASKRATCGEASQRAGDPEDFRDFRWCPGPGHLQAMEIRIQRSFIGSVSNAQGGRSIRTCAMLPRSC